MCTPHAQSVWCTRCPRCRHWYLVWRSVKEILSCNAVCTHNIHKVRHRKTGPRRDNMCAPPIGAAAVARSHTLARTHATHTYNGRQVPGRCLEGTVKRHYIPPPPPPRHPLRELTRGEKTWSEDGARRESMRLPMGEETVNLGDASARSPHAPSDATATGSGW